jgi:aldehyde:ferredoxin oxidoreductase
VDFSRARRRRDMARGYMGKLLFVDLTTGEFKIEIPDERLYREFVGGYGVGAKIIFDRQRAGVDPLGPENTIGFLTGPLTGTDFPYGTRYTVVVGKSPLTGGWGDANSGGDFGPFLKFSGYDGVFFTGASEKPVYLLINEGKAELRDGSRLWGKDTVDTEDILKNELGKEVRVACIGPAGENLSLISCVINNKGRAAARSGVGAVMGAKKLKAVAVIGTAEVPVADKEKARELRKKLSAEPGATKELFQRFGTAGIAAQFIMTGECPIKNWSGVGERDVPHPELISDVNVIALQERKYGCWRCPIACGGHMKEGTGEYSYRAGAHKPEYETLGAYGGLCLNNNLGSIIMANEMCNRYGMDTISAGATIAFAMECYEKGIITKKNTDGIDLTWGNHHAIVAMTEKMAKREGFGDVLADGSRMAAERIGKGAEQYAVHIHGQEPAMHDPRSTPSFATVYQSDATPGRHMQGSCGHFEMGALEGFDFPHFGIKIPHVERPAFRHTYVGKGKWEVLFRNHSHIGNASGACLLADLGPGMVTPVDAIPAALSLITGWKFSPEEVLRMGERIATIRQAINVREGLKPEDFKMPGRTVGNPPLTEGPVANVTVDVETMVAEYYRAMDWDIETGKPSRKKLLDLGLDNVAEALWP